MAFYRGIDLNKVANPQQMIIPAHFTAQTGRNLANDPGMIAQGVNHNTAFTAIWIFANQVPTGATKFRIAICKQNGTKDVPGTQLLANIAMEDIAITGTPDNPDAVKLGTHTGMTIGKILGKAPEVLPGGFDLFLYGDAAITNTVTFQIYFEYYQGAFFYIDSTFRTSPVEVLTAAS